MYIYIYIYLIDIYNIIYIYILFRSTNVIIGKQPHKKANRQLKIQNLRELIQEIISP